MSENDSSIMSTFICLNDFWSLRTLLVYQEIYVATTIDTCLRSILCSRYIIFQLVILLENKTLAHRFQVIAFLMHIASNSSILKQ